MPHTYVVIGGGASGLALVDKLQSAGHEVYVLDSDQAALQALDSGVKIAMKGVLQEKIIKVDSDHRIDPQNIGPVAADAIFIAVPNYGKDALEGRNQAIRLAKRISAIAPIIELSNGYKNKEEGITLGVINSPSSVKAADDGRILNYLSEGSFNIAIGNDGSQDMTKVVADLQGAGIGIDTSKTQLQVVIDKLPEVLPMGVQAILGTRFLDAANEQTATDEPSPTGIITKALLKDMHALAAKLKEKGIIENDFGDFDEFYKKQQAILTKKGESPGSLRMMMEAKPAKKTEADAIYDDVARLAEQHGVSSRLFAATYNAVRVMEQKIVAGVSVEEARKTLVIDAALPVDSLVEQAGSVNTALGRTKFG